MTLPVRRPQSTGGSESKIGRRTTTRRLAEFGARSSANARVASRCCEQGDHRELLVVSYQIRTLEKGVLGAPSPERAAC